MQAGRLRSQLEAGRLSPKKVQTGRLRSQFAAVSKILVVSVLATLSNGRMARDAENAAFWSQL